MRGRLRIGIDTGGTFTDVVAYDEESGVTVSTKTSSTPSNPALAFMAALRKVLERLDSPAPELESLCHGTTVATNALLQDSFAGLGFLTTEGFRSVLEIARQAVPDGYGNSYFWVKPDRIVPLHLVREAPGRLDPLGQVVRELDEESVARSARWFKEQGVSAVGISLIHSYANAAHEQRAREVLLDEYPDCVVSNSAAVLPEYREYERAMTTLIDAFVKSRVANYLRAIELALLEAEQRGPGDRNLKVMKSNGGVISASRVIEQPITTVLSGPAAGVLGASEIARAAGFENVLTLDAGGTSTDVSVVLAGQPSVTTEGTVAGYPIKVPMIDIFSVGTGGGSIAWITPDGGLKVGPRSAGAAPGPLCYGMGASEPTLTDAQLMLGRIPDGLLGGEMKLDAAAAADGIGDLAKRLGIGTVECAAGIVQIAGWNQANALRQVSIRRGLDIRDFVLCLFGGSGPLHACDLIDILGVPLAMVPPNPGNLSAFGLLTADVKDDYVRTHIVRHDELDLSRLASAYEELEAQARQTLAGEGFAASQQVLARSADLRYFGQAYEVRTPGPQGAVDDSFAAEVVEGFHRLHEQVYGYCYRETGASKVEWVNLRVTAVGPVSPVRMERLGPGGGNLNRAAAGERRVFDAGSWRSAAVYQRIRLGAGDVVAGPSVIEEFGSTLPLAGGFQGTIDGNGNVLVTRIGTDSIERSDERRVEPV